MKKIFAILMAAAVLAVSCQPEEKIDPSITLNTPAEVTVATDGEVVTVEFTTNVAWTASLSNTSWATLSASSGEAGTEKTKVTVLKNDTEDSRTLDLTITAESAKQVVKLTQLQKNALSLVSEETEISCDAQNVTFKVLSNINYTVTSDVDWITVTTTKAAVESEVTLAVELNKGDAREGTVTVKGEGKTAVFTVKQGAFEPVFNIKGTDEDGYLYIPVEGGTVYFQVQSNVEYTYKTYEDGSFPWQHVSFDGEIFTVKIDANDGFDPRTSYIKFTVPDILVDVLDDNEEPTGEQEALVARVYMLQDGNIATSWRKEYTWDLYNESHRYSTAIAGDYLLVSTGLGVRAYSKADGSFLMDISSMLPFAPTGITNDDAGNIIISVGGDFPLNDDWSLNTEAQVPLQVYVLPADKITDPTAAKLLITYYDGFYGYGLDNVRCTGNALEDACITMMSAAGSPGSSYAVCWEVKGGSVAAAEDGTNPYTDYVTLGWTSEIWNSANMVCKQLGTTVNSGIFAIGYDGNYNLHYNSTMSIANWQEVLVTGSSWAEGYNAMDMIEWNGHKYLGFIGMSYFAYADWDYDGVVDGYMPSYLWLVNIDDPAAPVTVSTMEYYADPDNFCYGSTTDLCLEVEDGNLAAYVLDSGASCYFKVVYPAL